MRIGRRGAVGALAALLAAAPTLAAAANPAEALESLKVEVIGTTPLPGLGTPLADVPANVQVFGQRDLSRQPGQDIAGLLDRGATGVSVGAAQGNPYQQDLSFRGFAASPLLGTPQGMSVFQDGVRINEAFGDVVNWDLLPQSAISSMQLIPGSNPVFGLNTLGGALALYTKSGAQYPGASLEASAGSFGRRDASLAYGGSRENLDYFVTGSATDDRGWAEHNPSRLRQFFGKVGYQDDRSDLDVSLTLADNTLAGTQTLPVSFLDTPRQAYTFPDSNRNRVSMLAAKGSRFIDDTTLIGGNAYIRRYRNDNFSSNVNDDFGTVDPDTGVTSTNEASNDRSAIDQSSWGVGAQLTLQRQLAGRGNQFVVGASIDGGDTRFRQQSQPATFTADRATVATGDFVALTDVATSNRYLGLFAADSYALSERWTLSLAGRYNHAAIRIDDRSGSAPGLDGRHVFSRFAPAVGINFKPAPDLTAYAAYNEGMRAPSPVELTCADAQAPCKLPNIFIADPPLRKVVSRTIEAGTRGRRGEAIEWSAAAYRTDLDDDIQFIASGRGAINAGFFQNVGRTRRQGIELAATVKLGAFELALRYSHTDATFRSAFIAASPNNSSADADGAIRVRPGDRIPGIPADSIKLRGDADFGAWTIGANVVFASSQYARGDENNRDAAGRVPGYTVVDLDGRVRLGRTLQLVLGASNVFDRRYQNFGILGANVFNGPDRSFGPALGIEPVREQFRAVGAPRTLWIALEYALGTKPAR